MKNFTKKILNFTKICLLFLGFMFSGNTLLGQNIAVIGVDHTSGTSITNTSLTYTVLDGFSFVATQNLTAGSVYYFTNALYNSATSKFRVSSLAADEGARFVVQYTVPAGGVTKGTVVRLQETATSSNTFNVTCSSGSCGTASALAYNSQPINFALGSSFPVSIYCYQDGDTDPLNSITTVHSVLFGGYQENGVPTFGTIPMAMDPRVNYTTAIVADGLLSSLPTELTTIDFKPSLRSGAVSKITLENAGSYDVHPSQASGETFLSTTAFANLNLVASNPTVSVTVSPSSVLENGATNLVYTFTLSTTAASNITVNYSIGGTATNGSDYATISGSVVIASGTNSATVTVDPAGDASLEPDETVILTVVSGSGYDAGSPSIATATITNDDTGTSLPKVALVGINHADISTNPSHQDGFSFVALDDLPTGTVVYFTMRLYDKRTLVFNSTYTSTVKWTAGSGVTRGDVYTVMETSADVFTVTCSDGSSCGSVTNLFSGFAVPTTGVTLFAYSDNNDVPTDGITEIYAALHTGDLTVGGNGGVIPTNSNPTAIYPNAVVVDNFPNATPGRVEYKFPTERQTTVTRTLLVNTTNWLHAQSTATALSTVRFTNIIVTSGVANPLVTVSPSPSSVLENSGSGMTYTFTLSQNAASNMTINFGVSGTATFTTDYTQTGATSFTASTGSVVIPSGSNSASVTITPVADATLEPNETVVLTIDTGTGYDAGNPNVATGTITNDDVLNVNPLVVIVGANHGTNPDPDGFSFAANQNLTAGTEIYFTNSPFNNTSLTFGTVVFVAKYTVPAGGLAKGQVVYVVETGLTTNAFTISCSAGSNCGTFSFISGDFGIGTTGANLYAYTDIDGDPTNSITAVHSLFYTINGAIPTTANPTTVFPNAVVVSGFGSGTPNRTEYKFASSERSAAINLANIQNTANYLIGQTTQALSVIPFVALSLCPASIATNPSNASISVGSNTSFTVTATGSNLTYQWQLNTGSGFTNINNGGIYSGATSATLTLNNVPLANNGFTYQCVVNDCATSTAATLTVFQVPVISVVDASNVAITNGGAYSAANNTDFGLRCVTGATQSKTYTIKNTGQANLTLSGSPLAVLGGTDASQFSITTQPTSPIVPGGSATFTVLFDPNVGGAKDATITLTSNDGTNSPYVINIHGVGGFEPTTTIGTIPDICAGATSFTIPFSNASYSPTAYSVSGTGITTVINRTPPSSPMVVTLSSPAVFGTNPNFTFSLINGNGCVSPNYTGSVTVLAAPVATASSNSPVCAGATINLTGGGVGTYSWSGPDTFTSTDQSPSIATATTAATGIYTITVTNTANCTARATTSVTVNTTPATPTSLVATPSTVCSGSTTSLSASGCAGTLSWFDASDNSSVSSTPTITANKSFYAKCTVSGCTSIASSNLNVTVVTPLASSPGNVNITWTGLVSTDWNTACNWNPAWVPDLTNNTVVIANTTNKPTISNSVPTINLVSINSGATLTVNSAGVLTVSGSLGTSIGLDGTLINDGTINTSTASFGITSGSTAMLTNRGTLNLNNANSIVAQGSANFTVLNTSTGIINGGFRATTIGVLSITNHGNINYSSAIYAISFNSVSSLINDGTINITSGSGISNPSGSSITNNACGKILLSVGVGVYDNGGTTTNAGLIQMPNALTSTGTFTNNGVVKSNTGVSAITNNKMVITDACPIFTLGGTNNYTVSGIFTDAGATTSAGTYTSVGNKFTANNTIPTGTQTLYAQVTNGTCTFVVPFDFNNVKPTSVSVNNTAICTGASVTLSASCASGTPTWYTTATGGTSIGTGTSLSQSPTAATTYYVACEATNCVSGRVATSAVSVSSPPSASANSNSPICAGTTLNLIGGSEGNTYAWAGPNSFISTAQSPNIVNPTVSATGTYTITVTNASNCTSTATVAVTVNATPTATASSSTPSICAGNSISLTGGGVGTYQWNGPNVYSSTAQSPTIPNATVLATGTYTITVTAGSCTSTATTSVTVNANPTATASSSTPTICAGNTVSLTGGGIGTYAWAGPNSFTSTAQSPTITNATALATGTYTITVTNASNCTSTATTAVTVNAVPTATASSSTPSICVGSTLSLTGGGVGTYLWAGPNSFISTAQSPTIASATVLATGTYTITVTNLSGCTSTATTAVTVNANPTATASSSTPVICAGNTILLSGGGIGTYAWTGVNGFASTDQNPTIPNASILASGTYKITVINVSGCTSTATTSITANAVPTATASSSTPVICAGNTISLSGGGIGTYSWTGVNGFTSTDQNPSIPNASILLSGTYKITVTNVSGCTSTAMTSVTVNANPTATASSNSPICAGTTLSLTGGGVGTYAWTGVNGFSSTDQNPSIPVVTSSGTYKITVTNVSGCTSTATTSVTVNALPIATASSSTPVICAGNTLSLSGGVIGTYSWTGVNGFASTDQNPSIPNASILASGTYKITVTNVSGCTSTAMTSVTVNTIPTATASSSTPVICVGNTLSLSGGGIGTYAWTGVNGFTSTDQNPSIANASILASGTYKITVTNVSGCTSTAMTSVTVNANPTATASSSTPVICAGNTISLSGGGIGTYAWTGVNGFTSTDQNPTIVNASILASGTYKITVTNVSGCTSTATTSVMVNANPTATASSSTPVICVGNTISLSGGGIGTYAWTGVDGFTSTDQNPSIANASILASGTYKITVTNVSGCTSTAMTSVTVNANPTATASSGTPVICAGNTISLSGGGIGTYAWTGVNGFASTDQNPSIANASILASGTYKITVTNMSGCTSTATTAVTVNANPTATASSNAPVCAGTTLNLTGGGVGIYSWTGVNGFTSTDQNPTITNVTILTSGTYKITVTNINGCTSTAMTSVTVNALPTATASSNTPICAGTTLSLTGGGVGTYSWTGVNGFSSTDQNPSIPNASILASGTYKITVTNLSGCTSTASTSVTVNALPTATASSNSPICAGVTLSLTGEGVGTYSWSGPNSYSSTAQNPTITGAIVLASGVYTITVTNVNGCTSTATTSVTVNALPTATASNNSPICSGATLNLTGGGVGTYAWVGPNSYASTAQSPSIASATASISGVYTLTVTNANGCTSTATTSVTVNPVVTTPTPQANTQIIFGASITLTATGCSGVNDVLKWYQSSDNVLVTMPVSPTVTTNYYAKCETTLNGITCISGNSADITVTVLTPTPPVATGATNCLGTPTTLTATGCSGSVGTFVLKWYQNADDALVAMPVSPLVSTDYYARCEQTFNSVTAVSAKSNVVTLTILNPPTPVATGGTIYNGQSISLTATGCIGTLGTFTLKWYQTTDNALVTMPVSPTVTTQYYAKCEQTANSVTCLSAKSNDVTVTVVNRIFVDITKVAAPIQNGNSWATAYGNLQTGLAAATAGVEVWVAKGTYKPTTNTTRTIYFEIPSSVIVYGGFAGTEDNLIDRNFRTNTSILSGDIGTLNINTDNSYHVVVMNGSSNTTVLDGFTITGGYANFDDKRTYSAPLAIPATISIETGSGIVVQNGGSPTIANCIITQNAAVTGGGLYAGDASTPNIIFCKFMGNQAGFGSGLYFQDGSNGKVSNTLISGNKGIGGAYNNNSNPIFTNVTFVGNGGFNGGIFNSNSQPIVKNSIIWGNSTPFNDTQSIITYSTIQGGYAGTGNLSFDPKFVNPVPDGLSPNTNGDYHVQASSLAIDRGENTGISLTDKDLDGNLRRYNGGAVDMGAYEFQGVATSNIVISAQTGDWEINSTWVGFKVPALGDVVIIDANHIVTINATGIAKSIEYRGTGQIKFKTTAAKLNIGF